MVALLGEELPVNCEQKANLESASLPKVLLEIWSFQLQESNISYFCLRWFEPGFSHLSTKELCANPVIAATPLEYGKSFCGLVGITTSSNHPSVQCWKLRLIEVQEFSQGHTSSECQTS